MILFSVTNLLASENPFKSPLPFKEATIHYNITGSKKGTQTTYIKNFGKQKVIYKNTNSKIMHASTLDDTLIMIDEKWTYHINLSTKKATKEPSLNTILIKKFNKLTKKEQETILEKKGKTFLGIPTQKESVSGVTNYMSKKGRLLLSSETGIMGYKVKTTASSIEIKDVNDSLFILPKDLKITLKEADELKATKILKALLKKDDFLGQNGSVDYHSIIQEGIQALDF